MDRIHPVPRGGVRRRPLRGHARPRGHTRRRAQPPVSGSDWYSLRFNGTLVGETGINAALCGTWNCPVLLVTGDTATCREATDLLGTGLTTVPVKQGMAV